MRNNATTRLSSALMHCLHIRQSIHKTQHIDEASRRSNRTPPRHHACVWRKVSVNMITQPNRQRDAAACCGDCCQCGVNMASNTCVAFIVCWAGWRGWRELVYYPRFGNMDCRFLGPKSVIELG